MKRDLSYQQRLAIRELRRLRRDEHRKYYRRKARKERTLMRLSAVRKAIAALVGFLVAYGVVDGETAETIVGVLTAIAVYAIPNDA